MLRPVCNYAAMDIAATRRAMGLTKQQMADAMRVHLVTIYRWENGEIDIPHRTMMAIEALAKSKRVKPIMREE